MGSPLDIPIAVPKGQSKIVQIGTRRATLKRLAKKRVQRRG